MPTDTDHGGDDLHLDRARAESFGAVAAAYDEHRPTYPTALIETVLNAPATGRRPLEVLDVGSGTGIAARQLRGAGAEVHAVEPDPDMAAIAESTGLAVEVATFEAWEPAGRSFDAVTFAQSFHWVEPTSAARKAWDVLRPGGALALMWNRYTELDPPRDAITAIDERHLAVTPSARPSEDREESVDELLRGMGFTVERHTFRSDRVMTTEAWLNLVFTYSRYVVLDDERRAAVRADLTALAGPDGVHLENDALVVLARKPG
ncbi:class I SAM-dependent methyltransferase [Flexivirga sp. B27]